MELKTPSVAMLTISIGVRLSHMSRVPMRMSKAKAERHGCTTSAVFSALGASDC